MNIELSRDELLLIKGMLEVETLRYERARSDSESVKEFDEIHGNYGDKLRSLRTKVHDELKK